MQLLNLLVDLPAIDCARWLRMPGRWIERHYQRCDLAELEDHLLDDIGLTRKAADRESAKPFWR